MIIAYAFILDILHIVVEWRGVILFITLLDYACCRLCEFRKALESLRKPKIDYILLRFLKCNVRQAKALVCMLDMVII